MWNQIKEKIKNAWEWIKRKSIYLLIGGTVVAAGLGAGINQMEWTLSCEVVKLDSPTGWYTKGSYVESPNGKDLWIYKGNEVLQCADKIEVVPIGTDVSGLQKWNIIGLQAVSEFRDSKGRIHAEKELEYEKIKRSKKIPSKLEIGIPFTNAAITRDVLSVATCTSCGSETTSHTVAANGDEAIVGMAWEFDQIDDISAFTYDSVNLTFDQKIQIPGGAGDQRYGYLYHLAGPTTGVAKTLFVSFNSTKSRIVLHGVSFAGVDQSDPVDVSGTASNSSATSLTATLTSIVNDVWMIGTWQSPGEVPTAGTNCTNSNVTDAVIACDDGTVSGAHSITANTTQNRAWGAAVLMLKPTGATAGGATPPPFWDFLYKWIPEVYAK